MKQGLFENPEKTRRAVVGGKKANFYTRADSDETYRSLKPFIYFSYGSHEEALTVAEGWVKNGGPVPMKGKRV